MENDARSHYGSKKNGKRNIRKIGFLFKRWFYYLLLSLDYIFILLFGYGCVSAGGGYCFWRLLVFGSFQLS